jgi:dolichol-phosphate mannosyltransferase
VVSEINLRGELHRYIPVLAASRGFSIAEIKISNLPRRHGSSKYGIERFSRGLLDLFTVMFLTRFSKRPLHLFGLGGIVVSAAGLLILGVLGGAHLLYVAGVLTDSSWNIHDRPILGLGILLTILGTQLFSLGLVCELIAGFQRRGRQPDPGSGYSVQTRLDH